LLVFLLVCRDDIPGMVEKDAAGTGSALVYGSNVFWHKNSFFVIVRDFSNPVPPPGMLSRHGLLTGQLDSSRMSIPMLVPMAGYPQI